MRAKQRIVIALVSFLGAFAGIFPHYQGAYEYDSPSVEVIGLGRHALFTPPNKEEIVEEFLKRGGRSGYNVKHHFRFVATIDARRVWLEIAVICMLGIGVWSVLAALGGIDGWSVVASLCRIVGPRK